MKPAESFAPQNIQELLEFVVSMLSSAPKFLDKASYPPLVNIDYVFRQLHEGLSLNRSTLGEEPCDQLMRMTDQMRTLFEADPDDITGETLQGCRIIYQMEDVLREVQRRRRTDDAISERKFATMTREPNISKKEYEDHGRGSERPTMLQGIAPSINATPVVRVSPA